MIDFIKDNSKRVWLAIATKTAVPSYVNTSEVLDKQASEGLTNSEFADPVKRIFPINNAANTWISAMYLKEAEDTVKGNVGKYSYNVLEQTIKQAAEVYGILEDVEKGYDELKVEVKQASDLDSSYGWMVKDASGNITERKYKIVNEAGVIKAANYFDKQRVKYPMAMRKTISKFILAKAAEYNADLSQCPASIAKEAGVGIPNLEQLRSEIERRGLMCKNAEFKDMLNSISSVLAVSTGGELAEGLDKIAELLDSIDHHTGLDKLYGKGIQMPADIVYSTPYEKVAAEVDKAIQLGCYVFDITKLAEVDIAKYEVLGESFVDSIKTASGSIDTNKLKDSITKLSQVDKYILEDNLKD